MILGCLDLASSVRMRWRRQVRLTRSIAERRCSARGTPLGTEVIRIKKRYRRPEVIEYGRLEQLTLGNKGVCPDNANQPAIDSISGNHSLTGAACGLLTS
jgi:transposase-like protein